MPDARGHAGAYPRQRSRLSHRDWRNRRAGAALDFQRLHDEGELVDLFGRQVIELEVFEQMHAVHHQRDLMHRQRNLRIGVGRHLDRPVVGAEQYGILGHQPLGGLHTDARARLDETGIVLAPQLAPAGIDDDGVPRLQRDVLLLQRALEILDRDLVSVAEHFDALVAGDVDQHAACDYRADVVNAELREPRTGRVLGDFEAIVPAVLVGLVGEAIELRADLPDLGNDELLVAPTPIG